MSEKIIYGIKNVYYSKKTVTGGVVTFGTPIAMPGATEISMSAEGEPVKVYADNVTYYRINVNQGYSGNLNVFTLPESFWTDILGMVKDSNDVLVEQSGAQQAEFALMFEFDTDTAETKRTVLYNCSATRPDVASTTVEDTVDPQPMSIAITADPLDGTAYVRASIVGDSNDSAWAGWFSSVYVPSASAKYVVTVSVDDGNDPVDGATVLLIGDTVLTAITDSTGDVTFAVPNGTYDVAGSKSGSTGAITAVTVSGSNTTASLTVA